MCILQHLALAVYLRELADVTEAFREYIPDFTMPLVDLSQISLSNYGENHSSSRRWHC